MTARSGRGQLAVLLLHGSFPELEVGVLNLFKIAVRLEAGEASPENIRPPYRHPGEDGRHVIPHARAQARIPQTVLRLQTSLHVGHRTPREGVIAGLI